MQTAPVETEIKIAVPDLGVVKRRLRSLGGERLLGSTLESNTLFDHASGSLKRRGAALRLRSVQGRGSMTFKGRARVVSGAKQREEIETEVSDPRAMRAILLRAGFRETFRYEKRREIWRLGRATVCLDATPLGAFVEIEGSPREIDRRARALGLKPASGGTPSITASYPALWRAAGNRGDMLLSQSVRTRR